MALGLASSQLLLQGVVKLCEKSVWLANDHVYLPGGGPLGPELHPLEKHGAGKVSSVLPPIAGKLIS